LVQKHGRRSIADRNYGRAERRIQEAARYRTIAIPGDASAKAADIRHVYLVNPEHVLENPIFFEDTEVKGGLVVVNTGGTKAEIVASRYRIITSRTGPPIEAPYEQSFGILLMQGQKLDVRESCATPISDIIRGQTPARDELPSAFGVEDWRVYVMGQIRYKDEGGVERFMGFCRERGADGRFRPIDDADYEYED
jgi:hypothetical protein